MVKKNKENLVLVGFGKHALSDMLAWRGTLKEKDLLFAPDTWPPRFRLSTSCSQKELSDFVTYVEWASSVLDQVERQTKEQEAAKANKHLGES